MGRFRSDERGGFGRERRSFGRGKSGGFGGRGGFRNERSNEMHDVVCSKCGKNCQVPFKPTGEKPVFCSDCFRSNDGNSRSSSSGGVSSDQIAKINAKLDKIIKVLEDLEIIKDEDSDDEELSEADLDEDMDEDDSDDEDSEK